MNKIHKHDIARSGRPLASRASLLVLLALAGGLVACGGGEDPITTGPTATALSAGAPAAAAVTPDCPAGTRAFASVPADSSAGPIAATEARCQ